MFAEEMLELTEGQGDIKGDGDVLGEFSGYGYVFYGMDSKAVKNLKDLENIK